MKEEGLELLLGAVGLISEGPCGREPVRRGGSCQAHVEEHTEKKIMTDAIFVAGQSLRELEWVLKIAWKLGWEVARPSQ